MRVVEFLEMIDVHHHQAQRLAVGFRVLQALLQGVVEGPPIGQPAQGVGAGFGRASFQLLLLLDNFVAGGVQFAVQSVVGIDNLRYQCGNRLGIGCRAAFDLAAEHLEPGVMLADILIHAGEPALQLPDQFVALVVFRGG